ncbi:NAC domain-containing protein 71 isoform X2 [Musa acuminata AAA Group]|uniref:NAC domain-containing protein 71 isoform X2 n=1 Tax=Musa acuminata AAA Group TaxID=214697 RepID=UPI0031D54A1E
MNAMLLPPGFRFHPTDEELVGYYLKRKVEGLKIELEVIPVISLYKFDPWELPEKSFLPKRDLEWFFFCSWDRKYPNGSRTNRATASGYWKATGKDRKIACEPSAFGLRKTLVFYLGRAPGGQRTVWIMHEYRLCEDLFHGSSNFLGDFCLCRVIKRSGNWLKRSSNRQEEPKAEKSSGSSVIDSPEIARWVEPDPIITVPSVPDASKASSEMYYTEEAFAINDRGTKCLPSFSSPVHCMEMCRNWEDITFQSLELDASSYGAEAFNATIPPPICRQGSEGEEANLWLQEDNIVTVM